MNIRLAPLTLISACAVLVSCETTGDPTQGGIFWSPTKAQARQQILNAQLNESQAQVDALESKQNQLLKQRANLRRQISEIKRRLEGATDVSETARLQRQVKALEDELETLSSI